MSNNTSALTGETWIADRKQQPEGDGNASTAAVGSTPQVEQVLELIRHRHQPDHEARMAAARTRWFLAGELNEHALPHYMDVVGAVVREWVAEQQPSQAGVAQGVAQGVATQQQGATATHSSSRMGEDQLEDVMSLKALGWSNGRIARELGVHRSSVGRLIKRGAQQ